MGGGLMQLVAYGAQDIYLTGNPQITFFKVVYRRHTNFSMECIEQTIQGTPADGGSSTVTVSRNGDLIGRVYVTLDEGNISTGSALISEVELEIGGQLIDRQYSEWMSLWAELSVPAGKRRGYKSMICDHAIRASGRGSLKNIQIPLHFWFCRNPGCYLPLIALQYHEVKLKFTWGVTDDYGGATNDVASSKVWVDYVYLDTDERRRFAQVSHEYLIEQIQRESNSGSASMKLNFNHPVKELIWTDSDNADYGTARLTLNGHDRFADQQEEYFQIRQPYDHHTAIPSQNYPGDVHIYNEVTRFGISDDLSEAPSATIRPTDSIIIPALSTIIEITISVIEAPLAKTEGDTLGVVVGTTENGNEIMTLDVDSLEAGLSDTVAVGTVVSTDVVQCSDGTTTLLMNGTSGTHFTTDTTIHIRVVDTGGNEVTSGQIHFLVKYRPDPGFYHIGECTRLERLINVYSFALKPEEHQPSGTCNFSRIDSARLIFGTAPTGTVNIYAVNYNVLRIMSGMGGLAYSN